MKTRWALIALLAGGCAHVPPNLRGADGLSAQEHLQLGGSYEVQGMREEAVRQYEAAVRRDPTATDGWLALGNIDFVQGRLKLAEERFRKALATAPGHPGACNNLAMTVLARGGDLAEAESLAMTALLEPAALRPYILDTLANIRLRQKRFNEALDLVALARAATSDGDKHVRETLRATQDAVLAAAAAAP